MHVVAETNRHAGHADIVRETIDGTAGLRADNDNLARGDADWWQDYRNRLERVRGGVRARLNEAVQFGSLSVGQRVVRPGRLIGAPLSHILDQGSL